MKKYRWIAAVLAAIMSISLLAGCSSSSNAGTQTSTNAQTSSAETQNRTDSDNTAAETQNTGEEKDEGKVLVAYFAYSENMGDTSAMDVDAITSASLNRKTSNTEGNLQVMAQTISEETGADVFHILLVEPHDADYDKMVGPAQDQIHEGYLPKLQAKVENLEEYDTVFLGTPVWWSELPPAVSSFLTENDLSGKTVIPFAIHLGSRWGKMLSEIEALCPGSEIREGLTVTASEDNEKVREQTKEWISESFFQ